MSEHDIQTVFFDILRLNEVRYPLLRWVFAIPNGSHRHVAVAAKLKREGVKRGIMDVFCCFPMMDNHGLWLEFKHGKNKLTTEQKEFQSAMETVGYKTAVCYSAIEAIREIESYLNIRLSK